MDAPRQRLTIADLRRAEYARQARANAAPMTALAVCYVALAYWYGDLGLLAVTVGISVAGGLLSAYQVRLPYRAYRLTGDALLVVGTLVLQSYLPRALIGPIAMLPVGLSVFACFRHTLAAAAMLLGLLAARMLLPELGVDPSTVEPGPALAFIGITTAFVAAFTVRTIRLRLGEVAAARGRLSLAEGALAREERHLAARQRQLDLATEALDARHASLERQLAREREAAQTLEALQADERDLAQAIHHDLREPLRSIVSFSQLIRRETQRHAATAEVLPLLAHVCEGGQRMTRMLDNLHRYAGGGLRGEAECAVDLTRVAREVVADLRDARHRSRGTVAVAPLPTVLGQPTQLRQLLLNLVGNALKFTREGQPPRVEVFARVDASAAGPAPAVEVCVRDRGPGIPPAERERVFGLFNRVADSAARHEGSGIGLALCRRIAVAHGFELSLESELGRGTTFALAVPRDLVVAGAAAAGQPETAAT